MNPELGVGTVNLILALRSWFPGFFLLVSSEPPSCTFDSHCLPSPLLCEVFSQASTEIHGWGGLRKRVTVHAAVPSSTMLSLIEGT